MNRENKKYQIIGSTLEAVRKNVSWLSKLPLLIAIPITILLALGIIIPPVFYAALLLILPAMIIIAAIIGVINFLIGFKNTNARCEHNLISFLDDDIKRKKALLEKLNNDVRNLLNDPYIAPERVKKLNSLIEQFEEKQSLVSPPGFLKRILQNLPWLFDVFFKYFVIIPGCIGAFGGILFLVGMATGVNLFQMGTLVMFTAITGVGGLVGFGIVMSICLIAMIALIIYKAKFEEKMSQEHKEIHDKEINLLSENEKLDAQILSCLQIKSQLIKLSAQELELIKPKIDVTIRANQFNDFYSQKKSKTYMVSGAILAAINEAVFMFAKYVTFTGLCIVVLTSMGLTITPVFFIGLTLALSLFTLIMAGIGVFKYFNALKAVNNLAEDRVLQYLRTKTKSEDKDILIQSREPYLNDLQRYKQFISSLDQHSGFLGVVIKKLAIKKAIEKIIDVFPLIKNHFRKVETIFRYGYIFAISLAALTSLTILAAGIAGKSIIGLGAILSASTLFGAALPVAFIAVIAITITIGLAISYYKKNYEHPLAKAQRDAANEKSHLVKLLAEDKISPVIVDEPVGSVKSPVRLNSNQAENKYKDSVDLKQAPTLSLN